jgi:hypothetical protein
MPARVRAFGDGTGKACDNALELAFSARLERAFTQTSVGGLHAELESPVAHGER